MCGVDRLYYDLNEFDRSSALRLVREEYFRTAGDWPRNKQQAGRSLEALKRHVAAERDIEGRFPRLFQGVEAEDPPAKPDDEIARIRCLRFALQECFWDRNASVEHGCVRRTVLVQDENNQAACVLSVINSRLGEVKVLDRPQVCGMTASQAVTGKVARLCSEGGDYGEVFGGGAWCSSTVAASAAACLSASVYVAAWSVAGSIHSDLVPNHERRASKFTRAQRKARQRLQAKKAS